MASSAVAWTRRFWTAASLAAAWRLALNASSFASCCTTARTDASDIAFWKSLLARMARLSLSAITLRKASLCNRLWTPSSCRTTSLAVICSDW
jgi:hypothetical protein